PLRCSTDCPRHIFSAFLALPFLLLFSSFFFVLIRLPPISSLFPYTTLFRSKYIKRALSDDFRFVMLNSAEHSIFQRENITALLLDRKSTRLNSSHVSISYAVFCLKKKNTIKQ